MAYNDNNIVVIDFETGSRNPYRTQPIQIAAIMVDSRKLEVIPNSDFESLMCPVMEPELLTKYELDALEDGALKVNKKNVDELLVAKSPQVVWTEFIGYLTNYKTSKSSRGSPIVAGYNNNGFDDVILQRLGRQYGGWNEKQDKWDIFHPFYNIDVFKYTWMWFENSDLESISLDSMRKYMGMSDEGAHDALVDVYDTAELLIRFLGLSRYFQNRVKFQNSCAVERKAKRCALAKTLN